MRAIRWGSVLFGLVIIGLGVMLQIGTQLPAFVRQYWPIVLAAWGVWLIVDQVRTREDLWAGTDYGTGLYVIRHRRRRRGWLLPGMALIAIGCVLLWANLDPTLDITFGPIVLIALGLIALISSLAPPPSKDF